MIKEMIQDQKRHLFLKLLLDSYAPQAITTLWTKLPLGSTTIPTNKTNCKPTEPLESNLEFMQKIHYSWIAVYISNLPKSLQPVAAASFPAFVKIMKLLPVETEPQKSNGAVDTYIHKLLIQTIGLEKRLPICFLPKSPLEEILRWDKTKITQLIDILPLSDAGREIKQIVDRNRLMQIYGAFSEVQKSYLKQCMLTKHIGCDIKLNLKNWQGKKEDLRLYIHKLGLDLFAKGLHQEEDDFMFYLSHLLDTGRGKMILTLSKAAKKDERKNLYYKNLQQAIKFLS
jgi:hypothetical protein